MKLGLPEVQEAWDAVNDGVRASLSDGQGYYLIAMILFGISASFLHRVLEPARQYDASLQSLIDLVQEPYRAESRPTLAAGITGVTEGDLCRYDRVLQDIEAAVQKLDDEVAHKLAEQTWDSPIASPLPTSSTFAPCNLEAECPSSKWLASSWTDRQPTRLSQLIVPAQVASMMSPKGFAVLDASRAIEMDVFQQLLRATYEDGVAVKNVYFIDLLGSMRISPAMANSKQLSPFRSFATASYVLATVGTDEAARRRACTNASRQGFATMRYLDLAGQGIVRTVCYNVEQPAHIPLRQEDTRSVISTASASPESMHVRQQPPVGVACFDLSLSDSEAKMVVEHSAKLFEVAVVRFDDEQPIYCDARSPSPFCTKGSSTIDRGQIEQLAQKWLDGKQSKQPDALSRGGSAVVEFGDGYFGATLIARNAQGRHTRQTDVLFVHVGRGHRAEVNWLIGFVIFAGAGGVCVARGAIRRSRRAESALIRGLPVGVIEMHETQIVAANDRAEELFLAKLPYLGSSDPSEPVEIADLIDLRAIIMLELDGSLKNGYALVTLQAIDHQREEGYSSRYYCFATRSKRWLSVFGSPILTPDRQNQTYATLQPCDNPDHLRMLHTIHPE